MKGALTIVVLLLFLSLSALGQSSGGEFRDEVAVAAKAIVCSIPDEQEPVSVSTVLFRGKVGEEVAVVIKVLIAKGWHIYAYVPADQPYINTSIILELPDGMSENGDWVKSPPTPSLTDKGVLNYEIEAVFYCRLNPAKNSGAIIRAGIMYQACDEKQCLPPREKVIEIRL